MRSITGTLYEELCTFTILSRGIILRIRNVLDKFVEKIKTHFTFKKMFLTVEPWMR